jgi:glutathione synthase/RimK-type ligase-like ATP-grasp enzyme
MNKVTILAKNKSTYFIRRCLEEFGERVTLFDPWSDSYFPESEKYLVRTTGIYGNDLDLMLLKTRDPGSLINPLEVLSRFRSKPDQYLWFEQLNLPVLPWIPVKGTDLVTIEKFFRLYPQLLVKPSRGQGGWGIEVLTWDSFRSWKKKTKGDEDYLLQPYQKDGQEFRYFFLHGDKPVVLKRKGRNSVAANFQRQGEAVVAELPREFSSTIEKVVNLSGALYGAIDLIIKDDHLSILELNAVPGIEQLEQVSGKNIMAAILKNLVG